jgi:hypothetical protein
MSIACLRWAVLALSHAFAGVAGYSAYAILTPEDYVWSAALSREALDHQRRSLEAHVRMLKEAHTNADVPATRILAPDLVVSLWRLGDRESRAEAKELCASEGWAACDGAALERAWRQIDWSEHD